MGKIALAVIVSLWVIPISILVNHFVPEPYMDEIFHIPQAQKYCKGDFGSWDPMITTPPGLYCLSLAHVASLFPGFYSVQAVSSFQDLCSTAILRSFNCVLAVICSIIVYDIITHLEPTLEDKKAMLQAVVLSFALTGAFSVVIRQTNIIWVLFVACTQIIDIAITRGKKSAITAESDVSINKPSLVCESDTSTVGLNLRKRRNVKAMDTVKSSLADALASSPSSSGLLEDIRAILLTLWHMKSELLISFSPFMVVLVAFVLFVLWNGSIVLGAKEAHAVTPHFVQILYFSLVSVMALAPMHFSVTHAVDLFRHFRKNVTFGFFLGFMALTAGFASVHYFSAAHPYLLADNRHYPFYLWRKIIMAHWSIKYLLVPLYIWSWLSIIHTLGQFHNKIWILAYFVAVAAVLVPAPLIEFRYYTIPFFFLALHSNNNESGRWCLTGMVYICVNVFTLMMFLFRPFSWDHEPGIQRFIW
ncbi:hypothetical protein K1719_004103 [Acacia pycnantha]|nr:hypothetical protein K1719_004103 [Acacia pycnantha]